MEQVQGEHLFTSDWYFIKNGIQTRITQFLAFWDACYKHHCLNSGTVCKRQACLIGSTQEENLSYMHSTVCLNSYCGPGVLCCLLHIVNQHFSCAWLSNFWLYIQTTSASKLSMGTIRSVSLS